MLCKQSIGYSALVAMVAVISIDTSLVQATDKAAFSLDIFCYTTTGFCSTFPGSDIHTTGVTFPLRISANRHHLVDTEGRPFLYNGDTG